MALILAIFLGLILIVYCANDKAKLTAQRAQYEKNHPPCKLQEEYLLACEYYHRYLLEGREDPVGDALYDARTKIYADHYLPSSLEQAGMSYFGQAQDNLRSPCFYSYNAPMMRPDDPPIIKHNTKGYGEPSNALGLAAWREQDAYPSAPGSLKKAKYTEVQWRVYCEEIDRRFEGLVLESLVSWGLVDGVKREDQSAIAQYNFHAKWINIETLQKLPAEVQRSIQCCGDVYEDILDKHQTALRVLIERDQHRKEQDKTHKEKQQQSLLDRPNSRGRSYNPQRYT